WAGTTVTATVALAVAPSASVTDAVSVWAPTDRLGTTSVAPVPRAPSRLDAQRTVAPRFPSSVSVATAPRRTGRPVSRLGCGAGATIVIAGGTSGGRTTTVRSACPTRPPASIAAAVTVCVPTERRVVAKLPPRPMAPSRSDVQRSVEVRLPSVASVAVPLKATLVPAKTRVPAGGAAIVTTGGLGVIVTWTWAEPTAPSESVAEATSVWLPSESITVRPGPGPSAPSRLDVHWMRLVTDRKSTRL